MNSDLDPVRERCDQALRDIVELDRQVSEGEIPPSVAADLRTRYETAAAGALAELDAAPESAPEVARPRRPLGRQLAYITAALVAMVVAVVLLPQSLGERPAGGFVSGNEVTQGAEADRLMSLADVEAAVAANPDAVGMRLALADQYTAMGEYGLASGHYAEALRRDPDNAQAQARFGWLLLQLDQPAEALQYVERALATEPALLSALWFKANIQLYGMDDPTSALATLEVLRQRDDLIAAVRDQVEELTVTARQRQGGAP